MKSKLSLAALALFAAAAATTEQVEAQSLSGTWTVESEGRRGPVTNTLTLVQDGTSLTGDDHAPGRGPARWRRWWWWNDRRYRRRHRGRK